MGWVDAMIVSFGLTEQEMMAASRPGATATAVVPQARFTVIQERSPGYVPTEESFLDKPWAKWAIGGGVALMLGGAYWYTRRGSR